MSPNASGCILQERDVKFLNLWASHTIFLFKIGFAENIFNEKIFSRFFQVIINLSLEFSPFKFLYFLGDIFERIKVIPSQILSSIS